MPVRWQDAEEARQRRSHLASILNLAQGRIKGVGSFFLRSPCLEGLVYTMVPIFGVRHAVFRKASGDSECAMS